MERLVPQVQHYAWGSETAIPELLGVDPDGRPWAELWIGDHARLPSIVASTGEPLDVDLPFLLKVLAAAKPLSIQTHPSLDQAIAGFEAENHAGIALEAANRTYRDNNHKPELICALTPFDALVGFRRPADIVDEFRDVASMAPIVERLATANGAETATETERLRAVVEWLLRMPASEAAALVAEVVPEVALAELLDSFYPGDRGALIGLLLHRVILEPGEAVFLGAGNLHAYISGVGVEIMANSDNVIRGGLTPKNIDVEELLRVVSFEAFGPEVQRAEGTAYRFASVGSGFELTRLTSPEGQLIEAAGPEILLVTDGAVQVWAPDGSHLSLEAGDAALVEAGSTCTVHGPGVAWRASAER